MSVLFPAALRAAAPPPAGDIDSRIIEPARKKAALGASEREAEESRKLETAGEDGGVTYQQVLERPDDIELNYRYARALVRQGELRLAAATLERILIIDSNLPRVRLFYAVVLFRLDSLNEAQKELETLKAEPMPQSLRREVDDYASEIRRRRAGTQLGLMLGAGLDYDDNRNAAPASKLALSGGIPVMLDGASTRKSDVAKTMLAEFEARRDLGTQAGHQAYATGGYYRAEQTGSNASPYPRLLRALNLQSYNAEAGFVYKRNAGDLQITPSANFNHLLLAQTTYLRSRGAKLTVSDQLNPRWSVSLLSGYTRQIYNRTALVLDGNERTGDEIEGGGGIGLVLTPAMRVDLSAEHVNQGALSKFYAYRRETFTLSHSWLLGSGQFLLTSLTANYDRYEVPQTAVSPKTRKDDTYRARATYGFPLGLIHPSLADGIFTFTYDYYQALSNITNFAYSDNKLSGLFAFKWSAGL